MTSQEFNPSDNGVIRGIHTDIILSDANELQRYLSESYGPDVLYRMPPEGLHYPLKYASLEFHKNDSDDLSLYANTSFDAGATNGLEVKNWEKLVAQRLAARFHDGDMKVYNFPHQRHDFYVRLDDVNAVRVEFSSELEECSVILSTESLSNLMYASEGRHRFEPDPDDSIGTEHIESLRRFTMLWSIVLDTVTDEFGATELENLSRPRIVIAAPAATTEDASHTEVNNEIDILRPLSPPGIEMVTSVDDGMNMIGGLTQAKQRLQEIADIFNDQLGSHMYGLRARHFLLHGPPGTGKTSLVHAFANELGARVWPIDSTTIVDMWVGKSGRNARDVFEAIKSQPGNEKIVVFLQEFEALALAGHHGTQERTDVKKQLNLAIDDISKNHPNIIIAADTNADVADLEPSLVRSGRIEPIGAPAPNEHERADVWAAVLTKSIHSFGGMNDIEEMSQNTDSTLVFIPYEDDINPIELAKLTDGMTGADFENILINARTKQFRLYRQTGEFGRVSQADLIEHIRNFGR